MMSINKYAKIYEQYGKTDVLFTKEVIKVAGLIPKNIILKSGAYHFPVVLYSASMSSALLIVQPSDLVKETLVKNKNQIKIRFYVQQEGMREPIFFFVSGKALGLQPYHSDKAFNFLPITFNDSPPQALIDLLAPLIDATVNAQRRRDERISITPGSGELYNIDEKRCYITTGGEAKRAFIRDISVSGASFITVGNEMIVKEPISLHLAIIGQNEHIVIDGEVVKSTVLQDKHQLVSVAMQYFSEQMPISYKMFMNSVFQVNKKYNMRRDR